MQFKEKDVARFWSKVKKGKDTECWIWTAGSRGKGYGNFWIEGATENAHRLSYYMAHGPVPEGLELDHICRNRSCVNPAHLQPVTKSENNLRGDNPRLSSERAKARHAARTHCKHGHEFTEENTAINYRNGFKIRSCRTCSRAVQQRWKKKVGWHTKNYIPARQQ